MVMIMDWKLWFLNLLFIGDEDENKLKENFEDYVIKKGVKRKGGIFEMYDRRKEI